MEVYPAGEKPIAGADGRSMCGTIRQRGPVDPVFIERDESLKTPLQTMLRPGDLLLTQGAGDIGGIAMNIAENLGEWLKEIEE